jgi:hypothetical protein
MPTKGTVKHNRTGEKFITKQGYLVEIIEYFGSLNCTIKFLNERSNVLYNIEYDIVKRGTVVNPYHPNKYNGYIGQGKYKSSINNVDVYYYKVWTDMLKRVYSKKYHELKPTYIGISLCEEWHNFQNFTEWWEENYKEYMIGWHLDKDIICPKCKVYSPGTCAILPNEINGMFISSKSYRGDLPIGVTKHKKHYETYFRGKFLGYSKDDIQYLFNLYKEKRESYTKEIAEKYKGKIDNRVYKIMINFKINIED